MKDSVSKSGVEGKHWHNRVRSHIAPDHDISKTIQQGKWANLPSELLCDIVRRLEESETSWPARIVVVRCGSVCKSWRDVTKEIVETLEICGRLTFPISLKQPGPRESPIQCFIKRNQATSTYLLYFGLFPSEDKCSKLLLAAKKIRRGTNTKFVISLLPEDFSKASNTYLGKLRSNFLGTKFTLYDSHPPDDKRVQCNSYRRFDTKQVYPRTPSNKYCIARISYELNVPRTRGPRRMRCLMASIPVSSVQEGGTAPTPTSFPNFLNDKTSHITIGKNPVKGCDGSVLCSRLATMTPCEEPMVLKNKAPRWHEQLQCWCLNFKGRVTVASVKNFQLVAAVDPSYNVSVAEQEKVILQFGKIGNDIFTMDYRYPLSAFQAFALCLSSFDTKPACE